MVAVTASRPAQSIAVRSHQCGLVERGTAVADDGDQVGITHFVEGVAFGEGVRLDLEIVVIGNALWRRLWIMAASAILVVELRAELLLVSQRDFFDLEFDWLLSFRRRACGELIAAGHGA